MFEWAWPWLFVLLPLPYLVETGHRLHVTTHFATFEGALAFLVEHVDDAQAPRMLGRWFDGERDGLTTDERDAAALASDLRPASGARVNPQPQCHFCGSVVDRDSYCYGCHVHVCERCEHPMADERPHGPHKPSDHLRRASSEQS